MRPLGATQPQLSQYQSRGAWVIREDDISFPRWKLWSVFRQGRRWIWFPRTGLGFASNDHLRYVRYVYGPGQRSLLARAALCSTYTAWRNRNRFTCFLTPILKGVAWLSLVLCWTWSCLSVFEILNLSLWCFARQLTYVMCLSWLSLDSFLQTAAKATAYILTTAYKLTELRLRMTDLTRFLGHLVPVQGRSIR